MELLVVIGIIALLISILLPALSKARDAATTVACLSNMRQLSLFTLQYADANRGCLPFSTLDYSGTYPGRSGVDGVGMVSWPIYMLNQQKIPHDWAGMKLPGFNFGLLICPSSISKYFSRTRQAVAFPGSDPSENAGIEERFFIGVNSSICPRNDQWMPWPGPGPGSYPGGDPGMKLTRIKRPTEVMLVVDTSTDWLANGALTADWAGKGNTDMTLRYRHKGGLCINLSFVDGHAETWDSRTTTGANVFGHNLRSWGNFGTLPWCDPEYKGR